jgi:hypothetical protein
MNSGSEEPGGNVRTAARCFWFPFSLRNRSTTGISQIDEYFACRLILLLRGHFR